MCSLLPGASMETSTSTKRIWHSLSTPFGPHFNFSSDVAPAVAGVGNNVYFFAKGLDGRLFYNRAELGQGGLGWAEMEGNGEFSSAPSRGSGNPCFVAARGLDGNLYLNQADLGQHFGQWFLLS